ncbi:MAG: Repeat domain in Vibrio, Colwellia, Bradyrhizobium and Shewanella [Candidatus Udaeobacter sp.]|nr:MAG: Repeat domain in Vibrio, Colwellia, Bradyrhizobium and Shewanella [Candidatus Udaeobacter sp.]
MTRQTFFTLRRYLRWIQFFLVLLFLFVQLMPRALGQRQLSNKSSDANAAIPSVTQASPSSPLFNCTGKRYLIDEIGSFFFQLGTTDTGNHCDDCDTLISLPFPYTLYNQTFTSVYVNSNGRLDFLLNNEPGGFTNTCLPPPPNQWPFDYTIFAYWDDLETNSGLSGCSNYPGGCGIFTSESGVMPHRTFNIEFRTVYVNNNSQVAHFEVRLFEDQAFFDVVYDALEQGNASATAGVQRYDANFTQYFCEGSGNASSSGQRYTLSTTTAFNDFDHNGKPDYVLYNGGTRQTAVWYMNNNVFADGAFGPTLPAGWNVIDVADFNKDGDLDYALFNPGTRQTAIWYLSGVTLVESAFGPTLPSGWALVAVGDFIAGDCSPDYVLYNASTRQTAVWRMDDNVFVGGAFGPTLPAGWSLAGVADFNGNGLLDYLLFNASTRQSAIWYLSGATFLSGAFGPTLPSGWALTGTADFSGGGKPDYLLYNSSTRQTAIWYLSNNVLIGSAYGPTLPAGWNLVAP